MSVHQHRPWCAIAVGQDEILLDATVVNAIQHFVGKIWLSIRTIAEQVCGPLNHRLFQGLKFVVGPNNSLVGSRTLGDFIDHLKNRLRKVLCLINQDKVIDRLEVVADSLKKVSIDMRKAV